MHKDSLKLFFLILVLVAFVCLFIGIVLFILANNEKKKRDLVCEKCKNKLDVSRYEKQCPKCYTIINKSYNNDVYTICSFFGLLFGFISIVYFLFIFMHLDKFIK